MTVRDDAASRARVYEAAGGRRPLDSLSLDDVMPLLLMALTAQAVNIVLMTLFFLFDRRDVRRIMTPAYALTDLIFVPAGVLAAVLYTTGTPGDVRAVRRADGRVRAEFQRYRQARSARRRWKAIRC